MKKLLSIGLIILVLAQAWAYTVVYVNFLTHQEYISQNLCINKAKPSLHCNGKCHLMKELQKQDSKEGTSNTGMANDLADLILYHSEAEYELHPEMQLIEMTFKSYQFFNSSKVNAPIYHPPLV